MKIIANNITVRQGGFELQGVSFALYDRDNLVITGVSGSGKTTLAKALCGQLFVTGDLKINFSTHTGLLPKAVYIEQRYPVKSRNNIVEGYYQQRYNSADSADSYTVSEELKLVSDDERRIDFLLNELSIKHLANKPLLQLSSGEHKRFQLVKALLNPVQLLVADEPFVGLDVVGRQKLNNLLNDLSDAGTKLIIIQSVSHHFPDCVTHVLELDDGKQKQFTSKANFTACRQIETPYSIPVQSERRIDALGQLSAPIPFVPNDLPFKDAIMMRNVTVKYGAKVVLDRISWRVRKGERWLLRGKNGAGKSVLMSLVVADNPQAYANEVYLFDRRRGTGESIWDVKKNIGYVSPEMYAFFDRNSSCFDVVSSGYTERMGISGKLTGEQISHVHAWLQALNMAELAQKRLSDISSGRQRVVLLLRALVKNPPLLILDEPCQGLDEYQTKDFVRLVDDICKQTDTTLVYVSHYEDETPSCLSQVLELEEGRINLKISREK